VRTFLTLSLIVLGLVSGAAAQTPSVNADDTLSPAKATLPQAPLVEKNARLLNNGEVFNQVDDRTCYTMHTLVVAREKGSDRTRLVRQQTCTPSDRFRVNHSVQRQPASK